MPIAVRNVSLHSFQLIGDPINQFIPTWSFQIRRNITKRTADICGYQIEYALRGLCETASPSWLPLEDR